MRVMDNKDLCAEVFGYLTLPDVASTSRAHPKLHRSLQQLWNESFPVYSTRVWSCGDHWTYNTLQRHRGPCIPRLAQILPLIPSEPTSPFREWLLKAGHRRSIPEIFKQALAASDPAFVRTLSLHLPPEYSCQALVTTLKRGDRELSCDLIDTLYTLLHNKPQSHESLMEALSEVLFLSLKQEGNDILQQILHLLPLVFNDPAALGALLLNAVRHAATAHQKERVELLKETPPLDSPHVFAAAVYLGKEEEIGHWIDTAGRSLIHEWVAATGLFFAKLGNHPRLQEQFTPQGSQGERKLSLVLASEQGDGKSVETVLGSMDVGNIASDILESALSEAVEAGHPHIVQLLLPKINRNTLLEDLPNLLLLAAQTQSLECLRLLLPYSTEKGLALQTLAREGYVEGLQLLMDEVDHEQIQPALEEAALAGHVEATAYLLTEVGKKAPDVVYSPQLKTLLLWAVKMGGQTLIIEILDREACAPSSSLQPAVQTCEVGIVNQLMNIRSFSSTTTGNALLTAVEVGSLEMVTTLLRAPYTDKPSRAKALLLATEMGEAPLVQLLLATDLDPTDVQAAFHHSCERMSSRKVTALFLQHERGIPLAVWTKAFVHTVRKHNTFLIPILLHGGRGHTTSQHWGAEEMPWVYDVLCSPPERWSHKAAALPQDKRDDLLGWAAYDTKRPAALAALLECGTTEQGRDRALQLAVSRSYGIEKMVRQLLEKGVSKQGIQTALTHLNPVGGWQETNRQLLLSALKQ